MAEKCQGFTIDGRPCPNRPIHGDYCIIHIPGISGHDALKKFEFYGGIVVTAYDLIKIVHEVIGKSQVTVNYGGTDYTLDFDEIELRAESVLSLLNDPDAARLLPTRFDKPVLDLYKDSLLLMHHMATVTRAVEVKQEAERSV